jgi:hypothetical protein
MSKIFHLLSLVDKKYRILGSFLEKSLAEFMLISKS